MLAYGLFASHRRRIELEDKAKVVVSVWGEKSVQFLASLVVLPRSVWKKRLNWPRPRPLVPPGFTVSLKLTLFGVVTPPSLQ